VKKRSGRGTKKKNTYAIEDVPNGIAALARQFPVFYVPVRELYSSNTQLAPAKTKTGKPYLYLSEKAKRYKEWIKRVLDENYGERKDALSGLDVEELILVFAVREGRDTTNMVKTVEDALAEWLGVDDRLWGRVSLVRVPSTAEYEGFMAIFVGRDVGL